jgi:hypothetical protein
MKGSSRQISRSVKKFFLNKMTLWGDDNLESEQLRGGFEALFGRRPRSIGNWQVLPSQDLVGKNFKAGEGG